MKGPDHKELLNKVLNKDDAEKTRQFIKEINTRIDSTSNNRGPHWHRSDFSHDPRVQGLKVASDNPETWWKNFLKIEDAKTITKLHQIQDVAVSQPGQIVNGHKVTPEMISRAKVAVEKMRNGIKPDLKEFPWVSKNGPNMAPAGSKAGSSSNGVGNITQTLKSSLTIDKLHKAGKGGGIVGAGISGVVSIVKNGRAIYKNEKTWKDAGLNTLRDTGGGAVTGYVASIAGYAGQVAAIAVLGSNPVGWVAITATVGTSVVCSFAAGVGANKIYNKVCNGTPKLFKKMKKWFS
jgi:hypothetical protein